MISSGRSKWTDFDPHLINTDIALCEPLKIHFPTIDKVAIKKLPQKEKLELFQVKMKHIKTIQKKNQ